MFSALTKVLQKTLTSVGTNTYLQNGNKLTARSTADAEISDNSDSGEGDEENDGRNMVTIYEMDYSFYNEIDVTASVPSHQETLLSSVTTTGKPEDDLMMGSVFKEFPGSYNQANKNWGESASEEVTKVVSVVFKEALSETALKYLLTKVTLSENCKSAQAKLVSPVVFASVSPSIRSTDIKLQEIQRNMLKMTDCFIKLLSQLPNILKTNADHKDEKLESLETFLDGIKLSGHATQCNQIYYQ